MNLPELKKLLETLKLPVAYLQWPPGKAPALPYIIYYADEDNNFFADDMVYHDGYGVTIEVYSDKKDLAQESVVKHLLNENRLPYESYGSFLETENMHLKAYEINI